MERIAIAACLAALVAIPVANLARNGLELSPEAQAAALEGRPMAGDRLAGFGCPGAPDGRALYAREESSFPAGCRAIEPLDSPRTWAFVGYADSSGETWKEIRPGLSLRDCLAAERADGRAFPVTACEIVPAMRSPVARMADALEAAGCEVERAGEGLAVLNGCGREAGQ